MNSILLPDDFGKIFPVTDQSKKIKIYLICGATENARCDTIKYIAHFCKKSLKQVECFYSVLNPDNFCAVFLPHDKTIIADNSYFNKIISFYPTATKKAVFLDAFSDKKLTDENAKMLIEAESKKQSFLTRSQKYLHSANCVKRAVKFEQAKYVDREKVANYIIRFLSKNGIAPSKDSAEIVLRRASAVMPFGVHSENSEFYKLQKVFVIPEKCEIVSEFLITGLSFALRQCDVFHTVFLCGLTNTPEHIIIPELSVGFYTENSNHKYCGKNRNYIGSSRFLKRNFEISKNCNVYNEILDELIDESVFSLYEIYSLNRKCDEITKNHFTDAVKKDCAKLILSDMESASDEL